MYRNIVVPLDGSDFAEQALPLALAVARRVRARLQLVRVLPPLASIYTEAPLFGDDSVEHYMRDRFLVQGREYLDGVVRRIRAVAEVDVSRDVVEGDVAPALEAYATAHGADLVVMTTHGRGPLGRFWLGSVADELVRHLPIPVLLVRPTDAPVDLTVEPTLKHVLLPLDGTPLAEQMIEPAVELGRLLGAQLTLLRVIKPVTAVDHSLEGGLNPMAVALLERTEALQDHLRTEALAYLEKVAERLRSEAGAGNRAGVRVRTRVAVEEQPAAAVLEYARAAEVDLVALATHGRRGLKRLFLGSVADKVIRGGSVPVLVRRPLT
jgi:nucleotide-binding universal stress UspA family protein